MSTSPLFRYTGPPELAEAVRPEARGRAVRTAADLEGDPGEPHTYVVDASGVLRIAPRRSEHVACAGGAPVRAAGEISFTRDPATGWTAVEVSNLSTGYCPDLTAWPAVAAALDRADIRHPAAFTHAVVFRRCSSCGECNVVRDDWFVCVFCDSELPPQWNVDAGPGPT
ncbi:hypothetical protein [Streptomyces sp. AP-93]|uniref:hypothetical protein n=1 Tax=Streptomyces sp. AP-93 TaxID=2929048 RepID=UPI001FAF1444|nr:hypothetical protein [Streptomyces sp. AP-93]MCJ0871613.1 hypothetical protein [Streptomyces sp. AP-93]